MKKVLIAASNISFIEWFNKENVNILSRDLGCEVHIACNCDYLDNTDGATSNACIQHLKERGIILHNIAFTRQPLTWQNVNAYRELKQIIDTERFQLIHCHTPAVGVLTRLAAREARKKHGTKVLYTAHGFHFYQGAPLKNWLLYYPVEKFMCRYTDTLVTINEEDTQLAEEKFAVSTYHIHGVGVDSTRFHPVSEEEKQALRQQLGLERDAQIVLCVGELNANKNQATLIRAAALLSSDMPSLRVLLAGKGEEEQNLRSLITTLKLEKHIIMLGYCPNIQDYMQASDAVASCSYREGLPVNIIEGMLSGKPIVASDNRGHRELVQEGVSGFLVPSAKAEAYADRLRNLLGACSRRTTMALASYERTQKYSIAHTMPEIKQLYSILYCKEAEANNEMS